MSRSARTVYVVRYTYSNHPHGPDEQRRTEPFAKRQAAAAFAHYLRGDGFRDARVVQLTPQQQRKEGLI